MKKTINKILIFLVFSGIFIPGISYARTEITDWYLKDFRTEIVVNKDSSLTITESITADCDNLSDKHGIFRVLPTQIQTTEGVIKTPIELISITDFFGTPLKYTTIKDVVNHTITWKIGDPNVVVRGENQYRIKYKVKNAIRFNNPNFDELYWNLNGNFWEIETDVFVATIKFPQEINEENTTVDYYTGYAGEKNKDLAVYRWTSANVLEFYSAQTLLAKQGITASITFPKNIFTPYVPSFSEKYGIYLWFLLPVLVFVICFVLWQKFGKDPHLHKTVIPEFEIPENLKPMEMGMLISNGRFNNKFISAMIIDLATRGFISIEEFENKILLISKKDFRLQRLHSSKALLTETENLLLDALFSKGETIVLSDLKKKFYKDIPPIKKSAKNDLFAKELITKKGLLFQGLFLALGIIVLSLSPAAASGALIGPLIISGIILIIFSFIMPKRTLKGAELNWRVKGFKLYMETAEKYREQFNERENTMPTGRQVFEKLLPYAMIFGITKQWVKKMQDIYGEDYLKTHIPVWYVGASFSEGFDADSFASRLDSLSSAISANVGGPSGAGGGGFSGGGGGGGGGGGW